MSTHLSVPREIVRDRLRDLPWRAEAAFALRCAKRAEVLDRRQKLWADAYSAGIEDTPVPVGRHPRSDSEALSRADFDTLVGLNLGEPGTPGEPIRWDDPRLGPLWPDGQPDWYVEAEAECRVLEEKLRRLREPPVPLGEPISARLAAHYRLDERWGAGELAAYAGGYIISDGEAIYAHGPTLIAVWDPGVAAAEARGVTVDRLVGYFVPAD